MKTWVGTLVNDVLCNFDELEDLAVDKFYYMLYGYETEFKGSGCNFKTENSGLGLFDAGFRLNFILSDEDQNYDIICYEDLYKLFKGKQLLNQYFVSKTYIGTGLYVMNYTQFFVVNNFDIDWNYRKYFMNIDKQTMLVKLDNGDLLLKNGNRLKDVPVVVKGDSDIALARFLKMRMLGSDFNFKKIYRSEIF